MAVNPFTKEKLVVETLIEFNLFDEEGICHLEDGVKVEKGETGFIFYEGENRIAKVKDKIVINAEHYSTTKMLISEKDQLYKAEDQSNMITMNKSSPMGFTPPHFGVTVLGASHGFDASGSTSGYILWVNQRGIMIDPPPFSS
jgi:hypothetical protein